MQLLDRIKKSEFLGREFLLWLWFRSEREEGRFDMGEDGYAELWFDRKVVLEAENDEGVDKVTCSGENPLLREARFALTNNKEITEVHVKLTIGDHQWSFALDSTWLNFKSFKTPKVPPADDENPDGLFYDKFFLIEKAITAMDVIYASFIKIRVSPEWQTHEFPAMVKWISEGG